MWWWLLACAHPPAAPEGAAARVVVELDLAVESEADPPLPPGVLPERVERRVRFDLDLLPGAAQRDGSTLWHLRVAAARDPEPWPLEGRVLGIRRFDDGEVLRVAWARHFVGGDRLGGVFDLLVPVASPWVPEPREGGTVRRTVRWRMDLGEGAGGWLETAALDWRLVGEEDRDGERLRHLAYAGPWTAAGRVTAGGGAIAIAGEGTAEGEVWVRRDGTWVDQRFAWTRHLELGFPGSGGGGAGRTVRQVQRFAGRARRVAAEGRAVANPYPASGELLAVVDERLVPAWQACVDGGEAWPPVVELELVVAPDGAAAPERAEGLPPCGRAAVEAARFPGHVEDGLAFGFRVAVVSGRVVPPMGVEPRERQPWPVLLYRPPGREPAVEAALRAALGPGGEAAPGGAEAGASPASGATGAPPPEPGGTAPPPGDEGR